MQREHDRLGLLSCRVGFIERLSSVGRALPLVRGLVAGVALLLLASSAAAVDTAPVQPDAPLAPSESVDSGASVAPVAGDAARVPEGLAASDWSSIRAAYEAGRHGAFAVADGGHRARNPGQQWTTRFDGRGFVTTPDHGEWTWGLELVRWGFKGSEREVGGVAPAHADGNRVSYEWDSSLTEWYINDQRGLEHGYTVHTRPDAAGTADASEPLKFTLGVRGGLRPQVSTDGRNVAFLDANGGSVLNYNGLTVFDADGVHLPALFCQTASPDGRATSELVLCVDDRSARYPLTIDPIAQQAYLKASNTGDNDQFGYSVSVSGDTVVVGAYLEDSSATGVNGDQASNAASSAGAAYIFVRSGSAWTQQAYLKASNTGAGDFFGWSVSVSGDTVVVGAWLEDSSATGVNGDQASNGASQAGAAYIFVRSGSAWTQQAYLKASNTGFSDFFGISVSVSGDTVVVGAYLEASSATGVNGDQASNGASQAGAAYVFVRSGSAWTQQAYLKASNTGFSDFFGISVSVSGDTVVVGAYLEASAATGVNGDQASNGATQAGAAYVFVRSGSAWVQQAYLKASNTGADDRFGFSVSVSGDTVVVGAWLEDSSATGVNGDQASNATNGAGAAYVFVRTGSAWTQQAYLKASNTGADDWFGYSVSVSGDTVVVGAYNEDSAATGVNGDQASNGATQAGAAYIFVRNGSGWTQQAYLKASNTGADDWFGYSVSVSGDTVVVGAYGEDSSATGVNGDQASNAASSAGAAYVFVVQDCNGNGIADVVDIALGTSLDCNLNGIPDECDVASGCTVDANNNGIPDQCEAPSCAADLNGDGIVDGADLAIVLGSWGTCSP